MMSYINQADNYYKLTTLLQIHIWSNLYLPQKCVFVHTPTIFFSQLKKLKHQARTKDSHKAKLYVLKVAIILALQKKKTYTADCPYYWWTKSNFKPDWDGWALVEIDCE